MTMSAAGITVPMMTAAMMMAAASTMAMGLRLMRGAGADAMAATTAVAGAVRSPRRLMISTVLVKAEVLNARAEASVTASDAGR